MERQPPTILSDLELTLPHAASARGGLRPSSSTELLGRRDEPRLGSGSDDAALRVIVTPLALGGVELAAAHRRGHSVGRPSAALPLALAGELRDVRRMQAFDGLDDVPWARLKHAYGEASDVPGQIRDLLSENAEERDEALHELFGNIWHQGTVYEATRHALPFLIEALRNERLKERESVAMLIASIITGTGYHMVHSKIPLINPFTQESLPSRPDLAELLAEERRVVGNVRAAGAAALDLLVPYLQDDFEDLRATVARALALYPSRADDFRPVLEEALRHEKESEIRDAIHDALRQLEQGTAEQANAD